MPLEIKELVIRATVDGGGQSGAESSGGGGSKPGQKEEIVAECVAQVMEILRREKER